VPNPEPGVLGDLSNWVSDVIRSIGYLGVALLVALESVFPPIPSEVVLPFAGFYAGKGEASVVGMMLAATAGSVLGAWILYGIAAWIGPVRLRSFVVRRGKWFGVKERDLDRAEAWFDKRANAAVFLGRCVPLVRSIVSIPAGFRHMPFVPFTVYTALGSLVWNIALVGAGAILGARWREVGDYVAILQWIVIVGIIGLLGWFAWTRFLRPRLARAGDLPDPD
jgi:membrane protein DedA with SNARE-associated domain